jgi:ketosteroid isomerase-like protein
MATTAAPSGARPVNTTSASGSFNGKVQHIKIASAYDTAIFFGDFVKLVAAGTVEKDEGTATLTPIGIFMGCKYTDPNTNQMTFNQQWVADVAASDAEAYVLTDPNVVFMMQSDAAIAQTAIGANFAVVQTAGSTSIGRSKNAVDGSTVATTNTLPLRIYDFWKGPNSTINDTYTDVIMKFNVGHQYVNTTGV